MSITKAKREKFRAGITASFNRSMSEGRQHRIGIVLLNDIFKTPADFVEWLQENNAVAKPVRDEESLANIPVVEVARI
jgi:hypothetical protein